MDERKGEYQSWWESVSLAKFLKELIKHPKAVVRQIGVATGEQMPPTNSDYETFPTLSPGEADRLISSAVSTVTEAQRTGHLSDLIDRTKNGDPEALGELSSIAAGGNQSAQKAVREIDNLDIQFMSSVSDEEALSNVTGKKTAAKGRGIVWSSEIESGKRGSQKGDVPLHNNL
jgi:hypothetical protein